MSRYTVGIDVGGTNVKLGLVDCSGTIIGRATLGTKQFSSSKKNLIDAIVEMIGSLLHSHALKAKDVLGVGFGLPGLIDPQRGIVKLLPNISGWCNVPLTRIVQEKIGIPVHIDNDVNLITLGEWKFGAACGYDNFLCMTLGTGVGAGLILNGGLYRGEGFVAGELGHMPLNEKGPDCNCGGWGCFERYVGNETLLKKAVKVFRDKNFRLPQLSPLASQGDVRVIQFLEEVGTHIGNGLVGVVNLLNPRLIVIGGGVSNHYKFLSKTINKVIKQRCMKVQSQMVKITRAKLGDDAGIIGAQVLVKESIGVR